MLPFFPQICLQSELVEPEYTLKGLLGEASALESKQTEIVITAA